MNINLVSVRDYNLFYGFPMSPCSFNMQNDVLQGDGIGFACVVMARHESWSARRNSFTHAKTTTPAYLPPMPDDFGC